MRVLPNNIRVRTAILIAFVLMLFLSGFFAMTFYSIRESLYHRAESEVRGQLEQVLTALRPAMSQEEMRNILSDHDMIAESQLHYVVLEKDDRGFIQVVPLAIDSLRIPHNILAQLLVNPTRSLSYVGAHDQFRVCAVESGSFMVAAAVNTIFVSEAEDSIVQAFAYSLVLGLFVAIACGFVVANFTLSPLSALAKSAQSIASKPESGPSRLPLRTNVTEIGELIRSINALLDARDASLDQMRKFTADAAHELRTPLTVLKGEIEVELRLLPDDAEQREILESNLEEVERLISIVQDLLFLATMEGVDKLAPGSICDLQVCTERACERLSAPCAEKRIDIRRDVHSFPVHADEDRLIRLLYNILLNAIQYSRPQSRIEVTLNSGTSTSSELSIRDYGSGIPPADLGHIFDRFYRVNKSRSRIEGGAGLGLAISKSIADRYGFILRMESVLNEGTTVVLKMPNTALNRTQQ